MKTNCLIKYGILLATLPAISSPIWATNAPSPDGWTIDAQGNYTLDTQSTYSNSIRVDDDTSVTITENGLWLIGTSETPASILNGINAVHEIDSDDPNPVEYVGISSTINGDVTAYVTSEDGEEDPEFYFIATTGDLNVNVGESADLKFTLTTAQNGVFAATGDITADNISGDINLTSTSYRNLVQGIIADNIDIETLDGNISLTNIATFILSESFEVNSAISAEVGSMLTGTLGDIEITTLSGTVALRTDNNSTDEDVLTSDEEKNDLPANQFETTQATIYGNNVTIGTLSGLVTSDVEATGSFDYITIETASILGESSIAINDFSGSVATTVELNSQSESTGSSYSELDLYGLSTEEVTNSDRTLTRTTVEEETESPSITIETFGTDASISSILNVGDVTIARVEANIAAINSSDITFNDIDGTIVASLQGNNITTTFKGYSNYYNIYGIKANDGDFVAGNVNGTISSSVDLETLTSSYNTEIKNYTVYSDNATLGNISETGSISSITEIGTINNTYDESSYYNYYTTIDSIALYSDDILTTGNIAGNITATSSIDEFKNNDLNLYSRAIYSDALTTGDISGSITATSSIATIETNASSDYGSNNSYIYAYGIESWNITIGDISGNITATATVGNRNDSGSNNCYNSAYAYAIYTDYIEINSISSDITATATVGNTTSDGASYVSNRARARAVSGYELTLNEVLTGNIIATAAVGNTTTTDNDVYNSSSANALYFYGKTEIVGTAEDTLISAVATTGNYSYTGEEELEDNDAGTSAEAYALIIGGGSLGTLDGNIVATATTGNGYEESTAEAYGISSSARGGIYAATSRSMAISTSGTTTIDAINGNITVTADASATTEKGSYAMASGIIIGTSFGDTSSDETENYIGSVSGDITVTAKSSGYYYINGGTLAVGIGTGAGYSSKNSLNTLSSLKTGSDEETEYEGLDFHIGTIDGNISVITETGAGFGVSQFNAAGIQGFTGTDGYDHDLIIDTLSGKIDVDSSIAVSVLNLTDSDTEIMEALGYMDYIPMNMVTGIADNAYDIEMLTEGAELGGGEIRITDLSGTITVSATTLALDFSTFVEDGNEEPIIHNVLTDVSGINSIHTDVNIADFSGDLTVSVTSPEIEEGQEVQNGTVLVSGISAEDNIVDIDSFTGNITVNGTIEGEGTVIAAGIKAAQINGVYAGNISVTSDDYAIGMLMVSEQEEEDQLLLKTVADDSESDETEEEQQIFSSEVTIDGTIAVNGAEGQTYAIYAGGFDFQEVTDEEEDKTVADTGYVQEVVKELVMVDGTTDDTVNITTNASITGAIDLTGGDDTINLIVSTTTDAPTSSTFANDVANVEAINVLSGVWTLNNDYDYSTVAINGGTLTYAVDTDIEGITLTSGVLETTAGTLSNVGTLSAGTFRVSGTGDWSDLTLDGATLDLQRAYAMDADSLTFTSGTIAFNSEDTLEWGISEIVENQTLAINSGLFMPTTDVTVNGGTFNWTGGDFDLNHTTFTTSELIVPEGGILYGIGTVAGNVTNNGTIRPGYSPGTIIITGDFIQEDSGKLLMEIMGADYDVIQVNGNATINGTLDLSTADIEKNVVYTLISASGEISSDGLETILPATSKAEVTPSDDLTQLFVEIKHVPYTEFSKNSGQYSIGSTLDKVFEIADEDSLLGNLIATVDDFMLEDSVTEFLGQLAAPMSMNTGWLIEQGSDVMNLIKDQQSQTPNGSYVWAKGVHEHMDFDAYGNYGERNGNYDGGIAGFAMQIGESNWNLGGAISGIDGSLDNETLSSYDNETTSIWLLATHSLTSETGGWNQALRFGLGYSDVDVDAYDRFIFNGDHITSSYKGESYNAFVEFAMSKQFGNWKIEPSIGATYQNHTDDAHNDMLNGKVLRTWDDVESESIKGTLGCRAMYMIPMEGAQLVPYVNARFEYQFEDAPQGTFTWGGTSISGTLESTEWDEQNIRMGAGLMYLMDNGWATNVSTDILYGDSHDSYGVNAGVSYSF
jgi:hypothetical protein